MLNHIEIMGNLVADPEIRTTGSDIKVCSFGIACERDFAAEGRQKEVDFVNCVAWRVKAEFVSRYFSKGMPILISGRLQIQKWEDRDGNKRTTAQVVAENIYFAGGEKRNPQIRQDTGAKPYPDEYEDLGSYHEELPF